MATSQNPQAPQVPQPERLIKLEEVMHLVAMKKTGIYNAVNAKTFPAPLRLSRRSVCWPLSSINNWIDERIKAGGQ